MLAVIPGCLSLAVSRRHFTLQYVVSVSLPSLLLESSAWVMHLCLSLCMCVCLSVRARNSKTTAPGDLICLHNNCYTRGSVLLQQNRDLDMGSMI